MKRKNDQKARKASQDNLNYCTLNEQGRHFIQINLNGRFTSCGIIPVKTRNISLTVIALSLCWGRDLCSCEKKPTPLQVEKCCCWQTLLKQIVSYTFKWPQSCSEPLGMPVVFTMLHSKTSTRSSQLAEFKLSLWAVLLFSGKAFQRASCAFWILQETTVIQRFSRRLPCIQESLLGGSLHQAVCGSGIWWLQLED